jgi:hypothetical protein
MMMSRGAARNAVATHSNPVQPANIMTMPAGGWISLP